MAGKRAWGICIALIAVFSLLASCSTTGSDLGDGSTADADTTSSGSETQTSGDDGEGSDVASTESELAGEQAAPVSKYVGYESEVYVDPDRWLCLPGRSDTCSEGLLGAGLDITVIDADGAMTTNSVQVDPNAPIDCFYIYPTVSGDLTPISDFDPQVNQEITAVFSQAAGLGSTCRVVAPVYRQATLANLGTGGSELASPHEGDGKFNDVLDAWSHYMATMNDGRGVVLLGHSQGSSMILELLKSEFDGPENAEMRDRLVAAYLAGWAVRVPAGEVVGADLQDIPACTTNGQVGCVVSWSSYGATEPPGGAGIFGRGDDQGNVAICQHPGDLSLLVSDGQEPLKAQPLQSQFLVAIANATEDGVEINSERWLHPDAGTIATPFIQVPGLLSGACVERDGLTYLEVHIQDEPDSPRQVSIAQGRGRSWGLHIMDMSLVFGDVVAQLAEQAKTYSSE